MDKNQLRNLIIQTLTAINLYSDDAVNLIMGTIAQESGFGKYIKQIKGPALGICQIEPNTFNDILNNYLKYKFELKLEIRRFCNIVEFNQDSLVYNLAFSIAMCRIFYLRIPKKLPSDLEGYAGYWKKYYNTYLGAGTEEEFINNYKKFVL